MNQTSEWICKLSFLQEFTRAELTDLGAVVSELDKMEVERGVEYNAIQFDLQKLMDYY